MTEQIANRFRRFAEREAHGHSPLYEALANGVAGDERILQILAALPPEKQQPNLLFAAVRVVCGTPADFADFRGKLLARTKDVLAVIQQRVTQTNEPGRCAVLLPVLRRMHQPVALIEVGAAAGLCLLPDRYAYDYDGRVVARPGASPVFRCHAGPGTPVPDQPPDIAWRAGLDLRPVNLRDPNEVAWLEALVWPDQPDRLERLRSAISVAQTYPVRVRQGDLTKDLPALLAEAPVGPTLVVCHTAVLGYVAAPDARAAFAHTLFEHGAVWISNEVPSVFPEIAARAKRQGPPGSFLLAVNGHPLAWTDPHGAWIDWLEPA
ncbi:MAG: DUF2332 domain-containing protein [Acetobacteraceae bacterium]